MHTQNVKQTHQFWKLVPQGIQVHHYRAPLRMMQNIFFIECAPDEHMSSRLELEHCIIEVSEQHQYNPIEH
jgi:hypothetical protein